MAKICIFNTQVDIDSAGDPFDSLVPEETWPPGLTKPVRLLNTDTISYEIFYLSSSRKDAQPAPPGGMTLSLRWWQEFWGDDVPGSLKNPPPGDRILAAVHPTVRWSREVGHVEGPAGEVNNFAGRRRMNFLIREGDYGDPLWITTKVHAPWVRLALVADTPGLGDGHLFINAHVGGHSEVKELDAHGDLPYAYKFAA